MSSADKILMRLLSVVGEVLEEDTEVKADDMLIGDSAVISSRELVEILLAVEEFAADDLGVEFDWSSDSAMSLRRSPYRTLQVLADHLAQLQKAI